MRMIRNTAILSTIIVTGCQTITENTSDVFVDGQLLERVQYASEGATVRLQGMETRTNYNGCFLFKKVGSADTLTLEISKPGYSSISKTVPFGSYRATGILMEKDSGVESIIALEPITKEQAEREPCSVEPHRSTL